MREFGSAQTSVRTRRAKFRKFIGLIRDRWPITMSGAVLLGLSITVCWFLGVKRLDLVLLTAGVLITTMNFLLILLTMLTVFLLHRQLRNRSSMGTLIADCDDWVPTGFRASLPPWLPFIELKVAWAEPGNTQIRLEPNGVEFVSGQHRCATTQVVRRLTLGDMLGLTAISWEESEASPVCLLPAKVSIDRTAALQGLVSGEDLWDPRGEPSGDRVDVRKYGHGDSMRMILWKVYARTRTLVVRVPERALEAAPRVCAYLPVDSADEPAARLARTMLEENLLGAAWRFGTDGAEDTETLESALLALANSGSIQPGFHCGLSEFLQRAVSQGFGSCVLFLPTSLGPWLPSVQVALESSPMRVHAILVANGWAPKAAPAWKRVILKSEVNAGTEPSDALAIVKALALPGVRFTLADTHSGQFLDNPEAYLAKRIGSEGRGKDAA